MAAKLSARAVDIVERHVDAVDGPAEPHACWVFAQGLATELTGLDVTGPIILRNAEVALAYMDQAGGFARCYVAHMQRLGFIRVAPVDAPIGAFGIVATTETVAVKVTPDWWISRASEGVAYLKNTHIVGARCAKL